MKSLRWSRDTAFAALLLSLMGSAAAQTTPAKPNDRPPAAKLDEKTEAVVAYCKELYRDRRLEPLRGVVSLGEPPSAEMRKNPLFVSDEERVALDAFKPLNEQCRARMAEANPHLSEVIRQLQPAPYEKLIQLRSRQITIGQYNTYREEFTEKLRKALLSSPKESK